MLIDKKNMFKTKCFINVKYLKNVLKTIFKNTFLKISFIPRNICFLKTLLQFAYGLRHEISLL